MSRPTDFSSTAAADAQDSVAEERAAVGQHPDTGGLVPQDHSQHAPEHEPGTAGSGTGGLPDTPPD